MQLLRMLHFVAAHYGFTFTSAHLPGRCNTLADAISRNQANSSALISSQLVQIAHPVSSTIIDLVCDLEVDWTSDDWNISCALALSRYSYVNGPFVSFGLCTVSEVLRRRSRVAFPTSKRLLCLFVASLDDAQLSHATIKCYLSAARHFQICHSYSNQFSTPSRNWSSYYGKSKG